MSMLSAGLLVYRRKGGLLQVLLAHPGGPYFARKDNGAWTVPKGQPEPGEELQAAALREFAEEIGVRVEGELLSLGSVRQKSGKIVHCWALAAELSEPLVVNSNQFEVEWPPRSGRKLLFPEVDRAEFFELARAHQKIIPAQGPFLERLSDLVATAVEPRS